jgi:hypothetical protein
MLLKNNATGRKKRKGRLEFECHKNCRVKQAGYTVAYIIEKHKLPSCCGNYTCLRNANFQNCSNNACAKLKKMV